ncbi:hypothetical protein EPO04_03585 [Patescibacteria group bacterium]|nr:MAG: hypothetical protein EPO04_03585 [Patescibacteria group bacterium]
MSREAKILTAILVLVVGAMVGLFVLTGSGSDKPASTEKADSSKLIRDNSHKQGSGSVTVVEFGDFQCPSCGQAQPVVERIKQEYGDKITFVFRNFPLPMHQNAIAAAKAAEAAGAQNKYWEMNSKLYANQQEWSELSNPSESFIKYANEVGVADIERFKKEIGDNTHTAFIEADKSDGEALGVQGTPTFYINGQQSDSFTYQNLKQLIDQQLGQK